MSVTVFLTKRYNLQQENLYVGLWQRLIDVIFQPWNVSRPTIVVMFLSNSYNIQQENNM